MVVLDKRISLQAQALRLPAARILKSASLDIFSSSEYGRLHY
jgi:hypothetical protein